jgi:fimbrial chaperone protein
MKTLLALLLVAALPSLGSAGDWRVSPIRIDLGRDAKSGSVTVHNGPGGRMQVQLSAGEWTQDGEGKDRYADSGDLVFFPRILQFEPDQDRVVRVGIRAPAVRQERAYRLFIEEMPAFDPNRGTSIGVVLRFGVPVFVRPLKEEPAGAIASLSLDNGVLRVRVANEGNVHFSIQAVVATGRDPKGAETFRKEATGWYLLPGVSRTHPVEVPREACAATSRIEVEVRTDRIPLSGHLETSPGNCPP